jgi:hypothetical protein
MLTKRERQSIDKAALASFIASGKQCVKDLTDVPACRVCGRVPKMYARFNDGSVQCAADSARDCYPD